MVQRSFERERPRRMSSLDRGRSEVSEYLEVLKSGSLRPEDIIAIQGLFKLGFRWTRLRPEIMEGIGDLESVTASAEPRVESPIKPVSGNVIRRRLGEASLHPDEVVSNYANRLLSSMDAVAGNAPSNLLAKIQDTGTVDTGPQIAQLLDVIKVGDARKRVSLSLEEIEEKVGDWETDAVTRSIKASLSGFSVIEDPKLIIQIARNSEEMARGIRGVESAIHYRTIISIEEMTKRASRSKRPK